MDAQGHLAAAVAVGVVRVGTFAAALLIVEGVAAGGQVGAGAEGAAVAGDDHRAHRVVGIGVIEGGEQLVLHFPGKGVHAIRAVQIDRGDAVIDGDLQSIKRRRFHGLSRCY